MNKYFFRNTETFLCHVNNQNKQNNHVACNDTFFRLFHRRKNRCILYFWKAGSIDDENNLVHDFGNKKSLGLAIVVLFCSVLCVGVTFVGLAILSFIILFEKQGSCFLCRHFQIQTTPIFLHIPLGLWSLPILLVSLNYILWVAVCLKMFYLKCFYRVYISYAFFYITVSVLFSFLFVCNTANGKILASQAVFYC